MLVSSGYIAMGGTATNRSINNELQKAGDTTIGLNDADARHLAGLDTSGSTISLLDFYGKNYQFVITDPTGGGKVFYDVNLYQTAINAGWDRNAKLIFVIGDSSKSLTPENQPIFTSYFGSIATALYITGTAGVTYPNGVEIINYGYIVGRGGNGGATPQASFTKGGTGGNGQNALFTNIPVTIYNYGIIGGGGGGGGGGKTGDNQSAGGGAGGAAFGVTSYGAYYSGYVEPTVLFGGVAGPYPSPPYGGYGNDRWGWPGGNGGNLGDPGLQGTPTGADSYFYLRDAAIPIYTGGVPGTAGACTSYGTGAGLITWAYLGTTYGTRY